MTLPLVRALRVLAVRLLLTLLLLLLLLLRPLDELRDRGPRLLLLDGVTEASAGGTTTGTGTDLLMVFPVSEVLWSSPGIRAVRCPDVDLVRTNVEDDSGVVTTVERTVLRFSNVVGDHDAVSFVED
jgi:hypothetical protein